MQKRKRVLSGMRPTGRLHLGHYFGALSNWLKLQEEYDCFYFVADWHALTTHYEDTSSLAENTLQVVTDWLAVGLDPAKSTLFVQSNILEHAELHVLLSMITPLSWLERVPTYKEQIESLKDRDLGTYGFLGYPLLQAADIVMYGDARQDLLVPVGEDQAPHVELTREIVRRFDMHFGFEVKEALFEHKNQTALEHALDSASVTLPVIKVPLRGSERSAALAALLRKRALEIGVENFFKAVGKHKKYFRVEPVLREPAYLLTETPRLPGLDGRRMAKSYNNAIWLSDPPDQIREKVHNMMTDPQRVRRTDPGRPEVCPVFAYHKLFSLPETITKVDRDCRTAAIGCVDCKKLMAENLVTWIEPIQTRRREFEAHPGQVWDILDAGSKKAHAVAKKTMKRVRNAIFKWDDTRKPARKAAPRAGRIGAGN
ncbi:MAG TPA: tryptophan--tRNA ligase [Candidatus Limnocylindria bacterium]|nr:tryptophan--tRNA ligase [Candidatus Limnocylindria bacterium]